MNRNVFAVLAGAGLMLSSLTAAAAPAYQMPFACGETWRLATWSGHYPENAVDMNRAADDGHPVVASAAGRVVAVREKTGQGYGKHVIVDHGNGHSTLYAHLSRFADARVGDSVRQGQRIGYVGMSGTGSPHLHFEQIYNGNPVKIRFNGVALEYFEVVYMTSRNSCSGGGVTGVVDTSGAPLNVRSGPGTGYDVVGEVADGATVTIHCQTPGTTVTGPFGTSNIWDRIGTGRYIADAYVRTGSDGYVAPRCP